MGKSQRRFVDLHTHSTASDGTLSPEAIIELADRIKLAAVALTDHDSAAGLSSARKAAIRFERLAFVPGIEVSAQYPQGTMHILGYGIDENSPTLSALLNVLRQARNERNPRIIANLKALGLPIDMEDVLRCAPQAHNSAPGELIIGRLHIAHAMVKKGLVVNVQEAFSRYLGTGGIAYVDKEKLKPAEVISAIRSAGAIAVLAHPVHLNCRNRKQLEKITRELMDYGLSGIEAYHCDHNSSLTRQYIELSHHLKLTIVGGSDFHGATKADVRLGRPKVPLAVLGETLISKLASNP